MAAKGGNVKVRFGAETRDLERGAARAGRAVDTFAKRGTKAGGLLGTSTKHLLAYAGGITSIAAAAVAAKDAVKFTEDLAKSSAALARTTGLDIKTASEWVEISKVRGVQSQALNRGFITLAKNIRQVEQGSKTATRAFADLGVSQKTLASGDTNRILLETADAFKRMPDGVKQAAVAQQIFGRQSQALLPLLNQGSAKLREQLGLVDQYGVALDKHGVKQALKAVEAQRKWQLALDGIKVAFAQGVLPYLSRGVTAAANFIREMRTGEGAGGRFAAKMKEIWQNIKPTVQAIGQAASAAAKFAAQHPGVQRAAAAVLAAAVAFKALKAVGVTSLAGGLAGFGKSAGGAAAGASKLGPYLAAAAYGAHQLIASDFFKQHSLLGKVGAGLEAVTKGTLGFKKSIINTLPNIKGLRTAVSILSEPFFGFPEVINAVGKALKDSLGDVKMVGQTWAQTASAIRNARKDWEAMQSLPSLSLTPPSTPAPSLSPDRRRRGGYVYQAGGMVPAFLSSGEMVAEPDGNAWTVPGRPTAADNVAAMLKPGSAVLTWDGQARLAAGASLPAAVRDQAPHFRAGGYATWTKVGASVYGGTPNDDNGKGSVGSNLWRKGAYPFAELNWGHALGGLPDYAKLYIRRGSRAVVGTNEDIGPSYSDRQIDLHKQIAVALGISPTSFLGPVQIMRAPANAKPGPIDPSTLASTGTSTSGSRTIRTTTYAPPSPGTNRSSRATFDAGYDQGTGDPSNFGLRQARSDFYNQARSSIFGTWTTRERTIRTTAAQAGRGAGAGVRNRVDYGAIAGRFGGPWGSGRAFHTINILGSKKFGLTATAGRTNHTHLGNRSDHSWGGALDMSNGGSPTPQMDAWAKLWGWTGGITNSPNEVVKQVIYRTDGPGIGNHYNHVHLALNRSYAFNETGVRRWLAGKGYRAGGFVGRRRGRFSTSGRPASALVRGHRTTLTLGAPGSSTSRPAPAPSGRRTTGRAVRESQRTPRQAAYAGLWALLNVGIGKADQGEVKARLAHELAVIDGLSYDDLRVFAADAKAIYNRPWGTDAVSKTEKARVAQIIKYADTAIGRSIGRAVGVTEDVRDSIAGTEGRIDNQLTLAGIDPESAAGRQIKAAADTSAIGRLQTRRQALVTARRRALRAGRRDIAQNITGEITAVDDQILGLRVAIQDLTSTVGNATETAEAQLEQQRQTNELLQGQLDALRRTQAVSQSQYGVLAQAIADIASGQIGGRLGLAGQAAGTPGEVARY